MERKVANVYEDTRELINEVKSAFEFKSDDQAIKYMCNELLQSDKYKLIREYLEFKRKKMEEPAE